MIAPLQIAKFLPALPVVVPLGTAAMLAGMRKHLSRAAADTIAILAAALDLMLCALLLAAAHAHTIVYWFGNWYPRGSMVLGITFVIDPVSASIATFAAFLAFLALLFSWRFVDAGSNHFQPLMLVFLAGMCGFSLTGDLFNLFVFFELMSTAAFALCGLKTREPGPLQGAFNFAVTNTIAAFLVLIGIAFLYAVTGALNMAQIGLLLAHRHDPLVLFAFALITCGFLTKAAIAPFHFWLADAHAVAPTPVCVLFSGIMVELGLYAVLRLYAVIFLPALDARALPLRAILLCFGALTVVIGSFMCYAEHHVKRLLAFSTISHAGLMLLAIALQGPIATAGFLTYMLAHGLVKSALFFVSGILLHRLRTVSEPALFGKGRKLRFTAALWFLGALGLAGCPAFLTMTGEAITSSAAESSGIHWLSYAFFFAGMMTGAATLRFGFHTFFGWGARPVSDEAAEIDELPETREGDDRTFWYHIVPPVLCLAAAIALCFLPGLRHEILAAANRLSFQPGYLHEVYTGATSTLALPQLHPEMRSSILRGLLATVLALLLALSSVFRERLARWMRLGAFLEGPLVLLRTLQSGTIGDYVMWLTVGTATMGLAYQVFLR
jgi:multicomponent Na+:H+ antiporter subunit D